MPIIKILSDEIIAKIAAGEVVDRPACVVKELVENAIDAQAENIKILIVDGGTKEIAVIDDGMGMDKDDLHYCYKRHTTSKIQQVTDLENIASLGFRGEALYSISSVSILEISSRSRDTLEGNFIAVEEYEVVDTGILGMPVGTKVVVKDLFYNMPARKKYLKESSEELRQVTEAVMRICLGYPKISFKVFHNGGELMNIPKDEGYVNRLKGLFSEKFFGHLVPVNMELNDLDLKGYVSKPQAARNSKTKQFFYINNRHVKSNLVSEAVKVAYGGLLEAGKHPPYILFLELPEHSYDINVHPKKAKIKFLNRQNIHSIIRDSVNEALEREDLTFIKHGYKKLTEELEPLTHELIDSSFKLKDDVSEVRPAVQIHDLYLVIPDSKGLLIIDQHAAHERVLFEYFMERLDSSLLEDEHIELVESIPLELDVSDSLMLEKNIEVMNKIGLKIKKHREGEYEVVSMPVLFEGRNIEAIINGYLDDIRSSFSSESIDENTKKALSYLACRSAIKEGDKLSPYEIEWLLHRLDECKTNYNCPHGRPLKISIPLEEINSWFKR